MPREGSLALAFLGRVKVHDPVFSFALGPNNLALKRIVDLVSCTLAFFISVGIYNETQSIYSPVLLHSSGANARSTLPGMPPLRGYPELRNSIPPATTGPAPSIEPPLAGTPFTVE